MSVKIYAGRMIPAPIGRAYDMLIAARPQVAVMGRDMQNAWMVQRAVEIVDKAALAGETAASPLFTAWQELVDKIRDIRATRHRSPGEDFQFDLWLFPLGRRTLLIPHTEQDAFTGWLDGLPFVERYEYYDNTDRPDEVDARTWSRRRRDWEKVLPWGGSPSDTCLTMGMFNHEFFMVPQGDEAMRHAPSLEARIATHARRRHLDEAYRAMIEDARRTDPDFKPEGFGLFFDAERQARGDEAGRARLSAEIAGKLRVLTAQDLVGPR